MPHALLLSPDDQAVNAITGVLEEMSVTCERPLDGVSAAQKLNSQTFDLVLVDCENLPAAKLIFDVCRRGKNGHNPVPIAIVDGRAGLPTAFRLGAELILTKPVAKDQARTTIRTAVSRVRKDTPADEVASFQASSLPLPTGITATSIVKEDHAKAATAAASSQLTSFSDPVPSFPPVAARTSLSATDELPAAAAPAKLGLRSVSSSLPEFFEPASTPKDSPSPAPKPPVTLSDDPVMAELERAEMEAALAETQATAAQKEGQKAEAETAKAAPGHTNAPSDAPVFSYQQKQKKPRGAFVALMVLVIVAGGFYAAWMYQPGFRAFAQPQVDRVLALVGMALTPTQTQQAHPQSPVPPAPVPATAPAVAATPSAADPNASTTATDPAATTAAPAASSSPASATVTTVPTPTSVSQGAIVSPAASQPAVTPPPTVIKLDMGKTAASKPAETKKPELKKASLPAAPLDTPLPGENSAIILSSKGAEKRLAHSVPPKYPAEARSAGAEGTVVLKEVVDEDGKVVGVRLVEGNVELATAAMQAVKQWRYRPYVRDGKAQAFQTVVIVDFQKP